MSYKAAGESTRKDEGHGKPDERHYREPGAAVAASGRDRIERDPGGGHRRRRRRRGLLLRAALSEFLAQRGPAHRGADDGGAGRDGLLLRGVLAPLPFGAAPGEVEAVSSPEEVLSYWFPEGIEADPFSPR